MIRMILTRRKQALANACSRTRLLPVSEYSQNFWGQRQLPLHGLPPYSSSWTSICPVGFPPMSLFHKLASRCSIRCCLFSIWALASWSSSRGKCSFFFSSSQNQHSVHIFRPCPECLPADWFCRCFFWTWVWISGSTLHCAPFYF